jgi:hypothetical protein
MARFGAPNTDTTGAAGDPLDSIGQPAPARNGRRAAAAVPGTARGKVKFSVDLRPDTAQELRDSADALGVTRTDLVQAVVDAGLEQLRQKHWKGKRAPHAAPKAPKSIL